MFCVGFADIFTPKNINNVLVNASKPNFVALFLFVGRDSCFIVW